MTCADASDFSDDDAGDAFAAALALTEQELAGYRTKKEGEDRDHQIVLEMQKADARNQARKEKKEAEVKRRALEAAKASTVTLHEPATDGASDMRGRTPTSHIEVEVEVTAMEVSVSPSPSRGLGNNNDFMFEDHSTSDFTDADNEDEMDDNDDEAAEDDEDDEEDEDVPTTRVILNPVLKWNYSLTEPPMSPIEEVFSGNEMPSDPEVAAGSEVAADPEVPSAEHTGEDGEDGTFHADSRA